MYSYSIWSMRELAVMFLADGRVLGDNRRHRLCHRKNIGKIAVLWTDK